jgi:hypothetical protein
MSIFRVNLNNTAQGLLDKTFDSTHITGEQVATSKQRTVYIMGPGKINRKLNDGETFQDCNYYKRFCYPQATLENAILTVVSDDGSVYSDDSTENTVPYTWNCIAQIGSAFADNSFDIVATAGGYATFLQITNAAAATDVQVRLNGSTSAVFTLEHASYQVFNAGDLKISKVEIANNLSGAAAANIEVLCAVQSSCNS